MLIGRIPTNISFSHLGQDVVHKDIKAKWWYPVILLNCDPRQDHSSLRPEIEHGRRGHGNFSNHLSDAEMSMVQRDLTSKMLQGVKHLV